jgi:hypothetical protein
MEDKLIKKDIAKAEVQPTNMLNTAKIQESLKDKMRGNDLPNAFRAIENQIKMVDLPNVYMAIENQIKLADLPNVYMAIENQIKMADLPNAYRAIENQIKLADLPNAFRAIENQIKLADLPNVYMAIENQIKLANLPNVYRAIENQIKLADLPNVYRAIENQIKLADSSLFKTSLELQKKLFSSNLFNEDVSSKFHDLFKYASNNLINYKNINIGEIFNDNNFQMHKDINYQIGTETISIYNSNYKIQDIRNIIIEVLDTTGLSILPNSFNIFTKEIFHRISLIKESSLRSFILGFFSSLLASIIIIIYSPQRSESADRIFRSHRNEMIKVIEKSPNINEGINKIVFKGYRFVISKQLDVKQRPAQKSQLIGRLYFGQVVKILTKRRNWTLVEYRDDENNIIINGWVFTRYIKSFKI